jgi:xylulokinase
MNGGGDVNPERIVVTGGGTMSRFWMQIMADVFARPLVVVDEVGAAVGAARLAAPDPDVNTTPRAIVEPSRDLSVYQEVYGDYCRVVSALEASVFRQSGT